MSMTASKDAGLQITAVPPAAGAAPAPRSAMSVAVASPATARTASAASWSMSTSRSLSVTPHRRPSSSCCMTEAARLCHGAEVPAGIEAAS